ncbi:hypothetical protein FOMG_17042 [Fusarium oxysporum f. sp. melonis 26406]|uniref:Uncharacterized protein n=1 Tax=Fusarium oxysporum f. sp. melonis 26406 TaxID=1089452 RepID=W9ZCP8_FUSOX|nr:hypothetical protein FOMG_17042 [Fusarium oxysporum f. sp. melonis 26406]
MGLGRDRGHRRWAMIGDVRAQSPILKGPVTFPRGVSVRGRIVVGIEVARY